MSESPCICDVLSIIIRVILGMLAVIHDLCHCVTFMISDLCHCMTGGSVKSPVRMCTNDFIYLLIF